MSDNYDLVLDASRKDIEDFIKIEKQLQKALEYRQILADNIMTRMKANGLTELGGVRIALKPIYKTVRRWELSKAILSPVLADKVFVNVNIEDTKKGLYEEGFTDTVVLPLVETLENLLGDTVERLVVNDNTNNRE